MDSGQKHAGMMEKALSKCHSGKSPYAEWLASLRDARARAKTIMQVDRMELGLFGDSEPIGEGLSELRIHYGLVIVFIMVKRKSMSIYCYVAVINRHNLKTLNGPKRIGKITSGENSYGTQCKNNAQ